MLPISSKFVRLPRPSLPIAWGSIKQERHWILGPEPRFYFQVDCPFCQQVHRHYAGTSMQSVQFFEGRYSAPCSPAQFYYARLYTGLLEWESVA